MIFNPTRDQARNFLFECWRKHNAMEALTPLESIAVQQIIMHPEYHGLLQDPQSNQHREYRPELGETNPFLHLMMHLTIEEQISIDQPAGIRAQYHRLVKKTGTEHAAKHRMMECLGEMIWQAQRDKVQPDAKVYFACLEKQ